MQATAETSSTSTMALSGVTADVFLGAAAASTRTMGLRDGDAAARGPQRGCTATTDADDEGGDDVLGEDDDDDGETDDGEATCGAVQATAETSSTSTMAFFRQPRISARSGSVFAR